MIYYICTKNSFRSGHCSIESPHSQFGKELTQHDIVRPVLAWSPNTLPFTGLWCLGSLPFLFPWKISKFILRLKPIISWWISQLSNQKAFNDLCRLSGWPPVRAWSPSLEAQISSILQVSLEGFGVSLAPHTNPKEVEPESGKPPKLCFAICCPARFPCSATWLGLPGFWNKRRKLESFHVRHAAIQLLFFQQCINQLHCRFTQSEAAALVDHELSTQGRFFGNSPQQIGTPTSQTAS